MRSLLLLLLFVAAGALADDAAFLHCRGLADPVARLACYDALPLPTAEEKAAAKPEAGAAPAAATKAKESPQQFGLPPPASTVEKLDTIESTIPGHFDGWVPDSRIRLANGQVWQVIDGTMRTLDLTDPKVTIRRGFLGAAYYMEFGEHDNWTVKVKRLR